MPSAPTYGVIADDQIRRIGRGGLVAGLLTLAAVVFVVRWIQKL